jgi:hypothetical protein
MGNHLHLLVVVNDATQFKRFYEELAKKISDYIKRLLGVPYLCLWEGRPMAAPILEAECVIKRLAYFYANPARANLVSTISEYPGITTWKEFEKANCLQSEVRRSIPRILCPSIPVIGQQYLSPRRDAFITAKLKAEAKEYETLIVRPNAWMQYFGLKDADVESVNRKIRADLKTREQNAAELRKALGKKTLGPAGLRRQAFFLPHTPSKRERKIYVLSSSEDSRKNYIRQMKRLCELCTELFRTRQFDLWPPGMFRPPMGILASAISP